MIMRYIARMHRAPAFFGLGLCTLLLAFSGASHADWTKTESFEYSAKTSLKVTDPPGAKISVTIGSEVKEETLPAIFSLPDNDAFVTVKVIAADGETWNGKVEVKAHKQTVLKLGQTAKPAAPTGPGAKFIGKILNTSHECDRRKRDTMKFVLMRDGKQAYEVVLPAGEGRTNIELEAGHYTVRIFKGSTFMTAREMDIAKDGWSFAQTCL